MLFDWALIATAMALFGIMPTWHDRLAVLPVAVAVIACRQHALLVLGHEVVHGSVCRPVWLNDLLGDLLTFAPFGVSIASYRKFHIAHHNNLGTPDDPEWGGRVAFGKLGIRWTLPRSPRRFWLEVVLSLLGVRAYAAALYTVSFTPRTARGWVLVITWWAAALGILYATGAWWILGLWAWCMMTGLWLSIWFRIWTEHTGTAGTHRLKLSGWQEFFLLPHHIGLHYEHHVHPLVPFWRLPAVRLELKGPRPKTLGGLFRSFNVR